MNDTQPQLITLVEAATYIGVSERTLRRMIAENRPRPPELRPSLNVIRYNVNDLDKWLEQSRAVVPAE